MPREFAALYGAEFRPAKSRTLAGSNGRPAQPRHSMAATRLCGPLLYDLAWKIVDRYRALRIIVACPPHPDARATFEIARGQRRIGRGRGNTIPDVAKIIVMKNPEAAIRGGSSTWIRSTPRIYGRDWLGHSPPPSPPPPQWANGDGGHPWWIHRYNDLTPAAGSFNETDQTERSAGLTLAASWKNKVVYEDQRFPQQGHMRKRDICAGAGSGIAAAGNTMRPKTNADAHGQ